MIHHVIFRKFTLDELLTNVMIYWISGNIAASQRLYKEHFSQIDVLDRLGSVSMATKVWALMNFCDTP